MSAPTTPKTALILIDVQQAFLTHSTYWGGNRTTPNLETNIAHLLSAFRKSNLPIFHVRHHSLSPTSPLHPTSPDAAFMSCATPLPHEPIFTKSVNSAFIGTDLAAAVREAKVQRLVFVGLTTEHCVSTSVRMAANLEVVKHGFGGGKDGLEDAIVLVSDATATFDGVWEGERVDAEVKQRVHLSSLNGEFCAVRDARWVVEGLLGEHEVR